MLEQIETALVFGANGHERYFEKMTCTWWIRIDAVSAAKPVIRAHLVVPRPQRRNDSWRRPTSTRAQAQSSSIRRDPGYCRGHHRRPFLSPLESPRAFKGEPRPWVLDMLAVAGAQARPLESDPLQRFIHQAGRRRVVPCHHAAYCPAPAFGVLSDPQWDRKCRGRSGNASQDGWIRACSHVDAGGLTAARQRVRSRHGQRSNSLGTGRAPPIGNPAPCRL